MAKHLRVVTLRNATTSVIVDVGVLSRSPLTPALETKRLQIWCRQWVAGQVSKLHPAVIGIERELSTGLVQLTCNCCGVSQVFVNHEIAHVIGWDAPPYVPYILCQFCPASPMMMSDSWREQHSSTHTRWDKEGRPT